MVCDGLLVGKYVDLRSCTEDDAEFTLDVRNGSEIVKSFPKLSNTLEQQKVWIRNQRIKPGDYFFVIQDKKSNSLGTISIYNIKGDFAEIGRLIAKGTFMQNIESLLIVFRFAFHKLMLKKLYGFIFADNHRALRFNKLFGGKQQNPVEDENGRLIINFECNNDDFPQINQKISLILYSDNSNLLSNMERT